MLVGDDDVLDLHLTIIYQKNIRLIIYPQYNEIPVYQSHQNYQCQLFEIIHHILFVLEDNMQQVLHILLILNVLIVNQHIVQLHLLSHHYYHHMHQMLYQQVIEMIYYYDDNDFELSKTVFLRNNIQAMTTTMQMMKVTTSAVTKMRRRRRTMMMVLA